jgi:hypothetical protein
MCPKGFCRLFRLAQPFLCPLRNTVQDWARCPSKLFHVLRFRETHRNLPCWRGGPKSWVNKGFYFEPGNITALAASA